MKSTAGELRFQQAVCGKFRDVCADAHILGIACAEIAAVSYRESLRKADCFV